MTTGEWFLGGATLLLALGAFWAIWQNYIFRKEERNFRLKTVALDNIHKWIIDIVNTTSLYQSAVREGDEKQKLIAKSQCTAVFLHGAEMLVAAGIFGDDLLDKVEQVDSATQAYHDALGNVMPG